MTPELSRAIAAVGTPESPEERVARVRAALERWGLLGLAAEVAIAHGVELDELLSRGRTAVVARARHTTWRRLYVERFWSCPQLAQVFAVDPTSVREALVRLGAEVPS